MKLISKLLLLLVASCLAVLVAADNGIAISSDLPRPLPGITNFVVSPASISSGSGAVLSWEVKDATVAYIDHGIGNVDVSGQITIAPAYSTTYKLTVSNGSGTRIRYITLNVEQLHTINADTVGCDPVSGRNAEIDLKWEEYCLSKQYQVQIARDPYFTLKVYDSGPMETADAMLPALMYPPGNLEAGHTYYWRVRTRQAATGQYVLSYWSEPRAFTVQPGYPVIAGYASIQAFTPPNGCSSCPVKPVSFSWSGYPGTTRYRFLLAKDAQLQNVVEEAFTTTTSYALLKILDYDSSYFWQVTAIDPIPSDPSSVFTFQTEIAPQTANIRVSSDISEAIPPWAILVMSIAGILIAFMLVLIVRARNQL